MPKIESEKIDCLYRPCPRPASRGKIESVRTHSEVIEQFDSFSLLKFLFLVRTGIAGHEKLFLAKWHPKAEKRLLKRRFFETADRHEMLYGRSQLYASAQDAMKLAVFFRHFRVFPWHFNKKQRAEVIFRPVSCKNQENGSGKQWSLHSTQDPWFEFLVSFDFFAPWYRRSREASSVKFHKIFQRKSWSDVPPKLLASIRFLYKVVHKNGRLRKFNRAREIEFNFFIAWTIFMKLGTLVHHTYGYNWDRHARQTTGAYMLERSRAWAR